MVLHDEYEPLVKRGMAGAAAAVLDADDGKWIDADELALEFAGERIAAARKAAGLT